MKNREHFVTRFRQPTPWVWVSRFHQNDIVEIVICIVNFRVIRVKVVAPEKPLDINIFPKNTLMQFYCFSCLKISLCWYGKLRYPKILYVDLDHQSKWTKCWPQFKTHTALSPSTYVLSPICNISFSLSVPSAQFPAMFYLYWFHIKSAWCSNIIIIDWLTINIWGCTCCFTYTSNTIFDLSLIIFFSF